VVFFFRPTANGLVAFPKATIGSLAWTRFSIQRFFFFFRTICIEPRARPEKNRNSDLVKYASASNGPAIIPRYTIKPDADYRTLGFARCAEA